MSSYQDFRRRSLKRRFRRKIINTLLIVLGVVILCGTSWYALKLTGVLEQQDPSPSESQSEQQQMPEETPVPTATPQPVIISNQTELATANEEDANWNTSDYAIRVLSEQIKHNGDGTTAMDYRLAGLEENGLVDLSYFDSTAFLGDSITQGFVVYDTDISEVGARFLAYKSIGPKSVVDLTELTDATGVTEVALDALVEDNPSYVYLLLGTNTLVTDTDYSSFLAYYGIMIDMIYERLPGVTIYVQTITPVEADVVTQKAGLYASRLIEINDELAALALSKGCYFINLWEVLADENGCLKSEYAASDGIHLNTTGYQVWIDYLRTHTAYTPEASYAAGSSYKIEE